MSRYLLLRFDAPLMSFGGVVVDMHGVTMDFPGRSLLVGLFGNALGYDHGDALQLTELQQRLRHAVRQDRRGQPLADFQTASLGQPFLEAGWTTTGKAEARRGGSAKKGTHIRHRHYVTDAVFTIAVELVPPDDFPTLDELANALEAARKIDKTVCIVVETDRRQRVGGYESWWDVAVAEVSTNQEVQQARKEYEETKTKERYHL